MFTMRSPSNTRAEFSRLSSRLEAPVAPGGTLLGLPATNIPAIDPLDRTPLGVNIRSEGPNGRLAATGICSPTLMDSPYFLRSARITTGRMYHGTDWSLITPHPPLKSLRSGSYKG